MKIRSAGRHALVVVKGAKPSTKWQRRDRSESGDTLIEVLLALVVLGISALAILIALLTSMTSSAEYRKLATFDTVLRTAANQATTQVEQQSTTLWGNCGGAAQITFSLPTGYTAAVTSVTYWNGTAFVSTCVANAQQLITITVTSNGVSRSISSVLYNPSARAVPTAGVAAKLVFIGQPGNGVVGLSITPPPVIAIEDAAGNIVTTDLSPVDLSITSGSGTSGASLSSSCQGSVFYGVVTFSNCSIDTVGNNYTFTATHGSLTPSTSASFNIIPLVATRLVIISGTFSSGANTVATGGPITVQEQNGFGNPVPAGTGGVDIDLSSSSSGSWSFAATSGGTATTTVTIPSGASTVTFYYGDTFVGTPTITASAPGMVSSSQTETINAGAPSLLAFSPLTPGPGTAGKVIPNVAVTVYDGFGNVIKLLNTGTITMSVKAGSAQAGFSSGTTSATVSAGVATFSNLVVNTAGSYTLSATASGIGGVTGPYFSNAFAVASGLPGKLIISTTPNTPLVSGATVALGVTIQDSFGNAITTGAPGATDNIKVALSSGSFTAGATTVAAVSGVATFSGLQISTAGTYTITASDTSTAGVTTATTSSVVVTAGTATKLVITSAAFSNGATNSATKSFTVALQDAFGNPTTSATPTIVNLSSSSGGAVFAATSGGTSTSSVTIPANTISTVGFYGDTVIGTPTITAASSGLASATQIETITPGVASKLVITSAPFTVAASTNANQPFTITLQDAFGNATTSASIITVNLSSTSAGKKFANLSAGGSITSIALPANTSSVVAYYADTLKGAPTITAAASGLTSGTQLETILAGTPSNLLISAQPNTPISAGATVSMGVTLRDAFNNVVTTGSTGSTDNITVTLSSGSFASGATSVAAVNGVATFTALQLTKAGSFTITASDTSTGGVATATSNTVVVTAIGPSKLAITSAAFSATVSASATRSFTVTLQDVYGNTTTSPSVTTINLASTSAGARFAATSGGASIASVTLPANTSSVSLFYGDTVAGSPTITASASGLTGGAQIETMTPGAATKLVITSSPFTTTASNSATQPFTVTLEDQFSNPTTSATTTTLTPTGTSVGDKFSATSGGASAASITLPANTSSVLVYYADTVSGAPTITVAGTGLTSATQIETVVAAAPSKLVITSAAFSITATNSPIKLFTVQAQDQFSNVATYATDTPINLSSNSAGAIFAATSGGASVTSVTLPANTSNVNAYYADTLKGTPTITASLSGVTSATQTETITAGVANKLAITTAPFSVTAGTAATQSYTVTLQDVFGNATTSASVTTLTPTGTSTGDKFAATSGGASVATVALPANTSTVNIFYADTVTGNPTLTVAASGLTSATQVETVRPAAPNKLIITTPPNTPIVAGGTIAMGVTIQDSFGNVVTTGNTGSTDNIHVTLSSSSFASGSTTVAAVNGVATFSALQINTSGAFTITASDTTSGGVTTAVSGSIVVTPGPGSKLAITSAALNFVATNSPTHVFTIALQDSFGNSTTSATPTTVNLSSSSAGDIFATASAGASVASVTLPANTQTVNAYYGDTVAGAPTITVGASGLASGTQVETITAGSAVKLAVTTAPFTVAASTTANQVFTVTLQDVYGNATTKATTTTVNLSGTSTGDKFAAASGGATVASVTIPANTQSVNAYYADTVKGTPTITAAATGLTSGTQVETVTAGTSAHITITTQPVASIAAGASVSVGVVLTDTWNNFEGAGDPGASDSIKVTLSSGSFASGTTTVSAVNGAANFTGLQITKSGSYTITVSDLTTPAVPTASTSTITVTALAGTKLVITSAPFAVTASASATQSFTVQLQDTYSNPTTSASITTINLSSTSGGKKFATTSGGASVVSVSLPANTSSVNAFYGDTVAGTPTITAASGVLTSATQQETVHPGAGNKLVITSSPFSITASTSATQPFTVTLQDQFGNPTTSGATTTITPTGSSSGDKFASASNGASVATVSLLANNSSVAIYYADTVSGTPTISAAATGLTTGTQAETVVAAAPSKLAITTATLNFAATNSPTKLVTVALQDQFSNLATFGTDTIVNLSSSSPAGIFASTSGGASIATVTILASTSTINAYYGDTLAGSPVITVTATGLANGTQTETVTPGSGNKLVITSAPFVITTNGANTAATQPFTITLQDVYGNATTSASSTAVSLASTSGTKRFATTSGNTTNATSTTLPANTSSVVAYYADNTVGTPTIQASASGGIITGSQVETVNGFKFVISGGCPAASTCNASASATRLTTISLQTGSGSTTSSGSAITITFASTSSGAKFATSLGGASVTSITLGAGATSVNFYYGDTLAGTNTISVSGIGVTSATQDEVITALSASKLMFTSPPFIISAGNTPSQPFTVTLTDTFGNAVTRGTTTTISLSGTSGGDFFASSLGGATNSSINVVLPINTSSIVAYYADTSVGTPTISATASGLTTATQQETVI